MTKRRIGMKTLPYSFDLLFDIKTHEHLMLRYSQLKTELESMEELMEFHNILPVEGETDEF
jgi:hypothetical protein